jgi:branched chain amino acid efflux pump
MSRTEQRTHRVRDGARIIAPFAVAVAAFGVTFGVLARDAGLGGVKAIVFSATTFAGSAQFAAASVLSAGGTLAAAIAAAVLLNTRYVPIGLSVAPSLRGPAWQRGLRAQLVVDESWAVSHMGGGRYDPRLLLGAGLTLYCSWVAGTTIGIAAGSLLGDPETLGLDAAFPALFLALLAGQVHGRTAAVAALAGAAVAAALVPFVPPGVPVVAASVVCLIGLRRAAGEAPPSAPDGPAAVDDGPSR